MRRALVWLLAATTVLAAAEGERLHNGDFARDTDGWSFWFSPGQAVGEARWIPRGDGGALEVRVTRSDRLSAVQIYQGPFAVREGERVRVRFEARADAPRPLMVRLMGNNAPYAGLGLDTEVPLTTQWRTYELVGVAPKASDDARVDFFPLAGFQLDHVSVTPAGPETLTRPTAVTLGRGWRGQPQALLDDDTKSAVTSETYPTLPLLLTVDLGGPKAVRQVVVGGRENGEYSYVTQLAVEASSDGRDWRSWARASKSGPRTGPVEWRAGSLAVTARYLRLRAKDVRGSAVFTSLAVDAAPAEQGTDPELLPAVPPAADLAFLGWDYDRLGYDAQPGEALALRWRDQGNRPVETPATWTARSAAGDPLGEGQATLRAEPDGLAELPLALKLPDRRTPVQVTVSFPAETGRPAEGFRFDALPAAATGLRVVALFDAQDAEGWAQMITGRERDGRPLVDATADWPTAGKVDAALVAIEAIEPSDPRLAKLRAYVEGGGTAVVYGHAAPALKELLPVTEAAQPFGEQALSLAPRAGGPWDGFHPERGPRHWPIRVAANPGADVWATWSDGSPAVVAGRVGQGRVVYVGTGSGQRWDPASPFEALDELTLRLIAGPRLAEVARRLPAPRPTGPTQPGVDNVGRFGWRLASGGLVENLRENGTVDSPADNLKWAPVVDGLDGAQARPVAQSWLSRTVAWQAEGRELLRATLSLASPVILWQGTTARVRLPLDANDRLAYATAGGWRVAAPGDALKPNELSGGALVVFSADPQRRDVPRVLVLSRRPAALRLGDGLELDFGAGGYGALWTGRLFGLRRFAPGETAAWAKGWPADAGRQAEALARAALAAPWAVDETATVQGDRVQLTDRFRGGDPATGRPFTSAWGTQPLALAPLPPVLSLARRLTAPIAVDGTVTDLRVATKYGPLEAVAGDRVSYTITLPARDHFGVIPTAGRTELRAAIDHYALDGTSSVQRASGGMVASGGYLEDLRRYLNTGNYENPFASSCLDLYKWWYCFPTVQGRPAYTEATREQVDAHHWVHYRKTLAWYPHKSYVRYRTEPWTGLPYTVTFIWPTQWRDGVRYFTDQNESSAVIDQCLQAYARYYGDWDTVAAGWNLARHLHEYLPRFHDWAWMASSNQEYFDVAGIDMLNSEYPGDLAYAELARQVGSPAEATEATVLAAKALVPAVARFAMPAYVAGITAPGDPWRGDRYYYSFHVLDLRGQPTIDMRGGPESILDLAIGMLDTSKGTGTELPLAYKLWAPQAIETYERELATEERQRSHPAGWAHLMQRGILGWPRDELVAGAQRFHAVHPKWSWLSTMAPHDLAAVDASDTPLFLADWLPAEYLAGSYDPAQGLVTLRLANHSGQPAAVRLYSQRRVTACEVGGRAVPHRYDPATGWLTLSLAGEGPCALVIRLGEPVAPLHPYFTRR